MSEFLSCWRYISKIASYQIRPFSFSSCELQLFSLRRIVWLLAEFGAPEISAMGAHHPKGVDGTGRPKRKARRDHNQIVVMGHEALEE